MKKCVILVAAACLGSAIAAIAASAEADREHARWTSIDVPGAHLTSPAGINSEGVVAGLYWASDNQNDAHGFLRSPDGSFTTFDAGSGHTIPTAINSKGAVAGWYGSYPGHGFVRTADGAITTFDVPHASSTTVLGINGRGAVVGYYSQSFGFLRTPQGKIKTIKVPNARLTVASAVNDFSIVAGEYIDRSGVGHGWVRATDGSLTTFDIPGVSDPFDVYPTGVNSSAEISGWYMASDYSIHGFLRDAQGTVTKLDIGETATFPSSLNDDAEVVGSYDQSHGFVRTPDGQVKTFDYPTADHTLPASINRRGHVTGQYYSDADGIFHGFLLKP